MADAVKAGADALHIRWADQVRSMNEEGTEANRNPHSHKGRWSKPLWKLWSETPFHLPNLVFNACLIGTEHTTLSGRSFWITDSLGYNDCHQALRAR